MDELAQELGGERANLTFLFGPRYLAPLRYLILFFRTGILLLRRRPDIVYTQNPAIFCPLSCMPFCKIFGRKLVIDHHSVWSTKTLGRGFVGRTIRWLERYASSRANLNTTPHPVWAEELTELGARNVLTIYDFAETSKIERSESVRQNYLQGKKFLALAPHGGHPLERLEVEVQAAGTLGSIVVLLISGPEGKLARRIASLTLPDNVHYLGFIPKSNYLELVASLDVGLSITDEPFTVSHSLLEFAANRIPIISSNQSVVRELFGDSIIYVESSDPAKVSAALNFLMSDRDNLADYKRRIGEKQVELGAKRRAAVAELRKSVLT